MSLDMEYVDVSFDQLVHESDDARCYRIDGEQVWLPKSVHHEDDDPKRKVVWVEDWFAEKKGLV